ncbi:hypothetical protein ACRN9C_08925 [Shewanella frigidimarina]|uniref:hypothetical protein n=1 Tax=Shewanella frigidimarina TaxID=56812 RepID=UPI003D7B98E7
MAIEIGVVDKVTGFNLINESREMSTMLAALIKVRKGCVKKDTGNYNAEPRT